MGVYGVARLGSIHNTYNVPSEPERAAKARRAVVASMYKNVILKNIKSIHKMHLIPSFLGHLPIWRIVWCITDTSNSHMVSIEIWENRLNLTAEPKIGADNRLLKPSPMMHLELSLASTSTSRRKGFSSDNILHPSSFHQHRIYLRRSITVHLFH